MRARRRAAANTGSADTRVCWEIQDVGKIVSSKVHERLLARNDGDNAEAPVLADQHLAASVNAIAHPGFTEDWNAVLREIVMKRLVGTVGDIRAHCEDKFRDGILGDRESTKVRMLAEMRVSLHRELDLEAMVGAQVAVLTRNKDMLNMHFNAARVRLEHIVELVRFRVDRHGGRWLNLAPYCHCCRRCRYPGGLRGLGPKDGGPPFRHPACAPVRSPGGDNDALPRHLARVFIARIEGPPPRHRGG